MTLDLALIRQQHALGYGQCHVDELIAEIERLQASASPSDDGARQPVIQLQNRPVIEGVYPCDLLQRCADHPQSSHELICCQCVAASDDGSARPPQEPSVPVQPETGIDLEPIKAREAAATKGPWTVNTKHPMFVGVGVAIVRGPEADYNREHPGDSLGWYLGRAHEVPMSDAEFVAHARADIPALIAEVEALRSASLRETANALDIQNLRNVLCHVSQIFNGWRPAEEWSKWDEEVAQDVVAIQRAIDAIASSPAPK